MTIDEQLAILRRGAAEIISEADLRKKLESGKPLRVKLGVDPTAKDVTLGWGVVLRKLRDFQRLGHTACLIIGDFTAMIGDPSGKSKTRKQLTREEVQANVDSVSEQFYKILDPAKTEIYFNKDWLGKMGFEDVIRLASRTTVARIMERDDFTKRWNEHRPIALHEILYPLCQGMDSVEIQADVELGGTDQKFNNLVGRDLQQHYGQEPQVVLLCPLLVGTDGKEKMSQSLGNYVSIIDSPNDMFGKVMSIPDHRIENWFELCTDVPLEEIKLLMDGIKNSEVNPRDAKLRLAREIVGIYHKHSETSDDIYDEWADTSSSITPEIRKQELPSSNEQAIAPKPALYQDGTNLWPWLSLNVDTPAPRRWDDLQSQFASPILQESYLSQMGLWNLQSRNTATAIVHTSTPAASGFEMQDEFLKRYKDQKVPSDIKSSKIPDSAIDKGTVALAALIASLGMSKSNGAARDLIKQGGVSLDGEKVTDPFVKLAVSELDGKILRVGKHQFRKLRA